jgi:hypothetical protein
MCEGVGIGLGEIALYKFRAMLDGTMEVFTNRGLWGQALDTFS